MPLISLKDIIGTPAEAMDGPIGKAFDFFFDDEEWTVHYIVIDTGTWITSHKILLAVESLEPISAADATIHVKHSRAQIESSPKLDLAKPVSHWEENMVRRHYGAWPHWAPYHVGAGPHKLSTLRDKAAQDMESREHIPTYALHSLAEPMAFQLRFNDDSIEKLEDLLIDPSTWRIERFVFGRGGAAAQSLAADRDSLSKFDREALELTFDMDRDAASPADVGIPS